VAHWDPRLVVRRFVRVSAKHSLKKRKRKVRQEANNESGDGQTSAYLV